MKELPNINTQYWAFIISATTFGETAGDLISQTLHFGYGGASLLLMVLFVLALLAELKSKLQHPALYWLTIIFASLVGTTISDFVTRTLALGYGWGALLVATVLAVIFYIWRKMTKHVSVQDALDIKTEFLYWAPILTKPESLNLGNVRASLWLLVTCSLAIVMSHAYIKIKSHCPLIKSS